MCRERSGRRRERPAAKRRQARRRRRNSAGQTGSDSLRLRPPTRNKQVSPSEIETTGAVKFCFVAVLMQAHFCVRAIKVDQAGLGRAVKLRKPLHNAISARGIGGHGRPVCGCDA